VKLQVIQSPLSKKREKRRDLLALLVFLLSLEKRFINRLGRGTSNSNSRNLIHKAYKGKIVSLLMEVLYAFPQWFFTVSILLNIVFALTTLFVSFYAFKVYRLSGQRGSRLFGVSFLIIAIAYVIRAIVNGFIAGAFDDNTFRLTMNGVYTLSNLAVYSYMVLFVASLVTLAYTTFKVKSCRVYTLLILIVLTAIYYSVLTSLTFYIISTILLLYISSHYLNEYLKDRNKSMLLMMGSFLLLLASTVFFMYATTTYGYFILGNVTEFLAYVGILTNLISVLKHGQKKK